MIYKLSNREKILLKYVGVLLVLISFITFTNYLTTNLNNSKNELFVKLESFNQSKQLLAQIKDLKFNAENVLTRDEFLNLITDLEISYEINNDNIQIPGLSESDALKLLETIEENNVQLNSFNLTVKNDSLITMSIDIDE
tara:strand:- start:3741 stop:4160 length:420 start_codon:yes stop_codon:yes gene_type:complete